MKRLLAIPLLAVLGAGTSAAAPTAQETAATLSAQSPVAAQIFAAYPEILNWIKEPFWTDALLSAPPMPGTPWRIHDLRRPQPPQVTANPCPTFPPPSDAIVLFNGRDLSGWEGERKADWTVKDGLLLAGGKSGNRLHSTQSFGSAQIRLEYRLPDPPQAAWQQRGNSGLFLQQLYEIQILDSWNNPVYPDGMAAAIYGQTPPLVNASLPPGQWQCLDAVYTAPRFDTAGALTRPARVSVLHNGVLVQNDTEILGPTLFAAIGPYQAHGPRPLSLQDHGDAGGRVAFRTIWVRRLDHLDRQEGP